jgi:hypothetical protein
MPSIHHFLLIYLLNISITCQSFSLKKQPRYHLAPAQVVQDGRYQVQTLQKEASNESFLDRILGTDCYSKAIDRLSDCQSLDQEQKSRLAFKLTGCQLAIHGEDTKTARGGETTDTLTCPPSSTLKTCLNYLSDRGYAVYVEFLTHIDSMCIFLQNQEFDKYTKNTLNNLSVGMSSTRDGLEKIHSTAKALSQDTSKVLKETTDLAQSIFQQKELTASVYETIKAARQEATTGFSLLSNKQQETIALQETSIQRQHQLAQAQKEATDVIENNRVQIASALDVLATRAFQLAESQAEAQASQIKLSQELSVLAYNSHGIRETLDTVHLYQQRSDAALIRLLGKSYRFQDVSWYIGSFLVAIACGASKMTASARLPLVALLAINWLAERYLLDSLLFSWTDFSPNVEDSSARSSSDQSKTSLLLLLIVSIVSLLNYNVTIHEMTHALLDVMYTYERDQSHLPSHSINFSSFPSLPPSRSSPPLPFLDPPLQSHVQQALMKYQIVHQHPLHLHLFQVAYRTLQ